MGEILHELRISLPHEDVFSKVKNYCENTAYYSVCDEYGVDPSETWMYGDWFYTTDYAVFGHNFQAKERSPPENLTRKSDTQSKGFTRKGIENLVLSSQVKARSTIVGNSVPAVDAQKLFKGTFRSLIIGDLSIDTKKYQGVQEHELSKVDFSVGVAIYMLPSNLSLAIGKKRRIQQQNFR